MRKPNNFGIIKIIISVVLVLFILLLINYVPKILKKDVSTVLPIDFEYKETLPVQGILIKNERLYFSETNGETYGIVDEGIRVPVGTEIAQVISLKDMTFYKSELDKIESLINQININTLHTPENLSSKDEIMNTLINQIQADIQDRTYNSLKILKEKLFLILDNENNTQYTDNSEILSNEQLIDKKNQLLQQISNYNERLFSRHSGIVSYDIDYYEEVLNFSDLDSTSEYIFNSNINANLEDVDTKQAVFKIIDGHEYYIAIKLPKVEASLLSEKEKLEIEIADSDDKKINLKVPVIKSYSKGTEEIIILKSNEFLESFYNHRFLDLEIVILKKDSFKIPLESLIRNNNQQGVFVRSFYDVVVFRPIIINAKDDDFAYVSKGNTDNKIELEGKLYKTINEFSEIIMKPNLVTDGQILN